MGAWDWSMVPGVWVKGSVHGPCISYMLWCFKNRESGSICLWSDLLITSFSNCIYLWHGRLILVMLTMTRFCCYTKVLVVCFRADAENAYAKALQKLSTKLSKASSVCIGYVLSGFLCLRHCCWRHYVFELSVLPCLHACMHACMCDCVCPKSC